MRPIRVLIVDDHSIVRQGLSSIIETDPDFKIVGEASTGAETLIFVETEKPDIVLLDLRLADMSGVEICQRIRDISPETRVLILTAFFDRDLVNACLQAGAQGYLLKDAENMALTEVLHKAYLGHSMMDPRAIDALTELVRQNEGIPEKLSLREIEVLRLIAKGMTNKEIAATLHLSENTVKWYVKRVLGTMGAHNRTEAALLAKERGLL